MPRSNAFVRSDRNPLDRHSLPRRWTLSDLRHVALLRVTLCLCMVGTACGAEQTSNDSSTTAESSELNGPEKVAWFERHVRPIFAEHCYECHSATARTLQAGLRLDTPAGIRHGGDSGAVVVPYGPNDSRLIDAVRCIAGDLEMPPSGKLPEPVIARLVRWVELGAPMPESDEGQSSDRAGRNLAESRNFWSFVPPRLCPPQSPSLAATTWPRRRIDLFILDRLQRAGLEPTPTADRRTLLRRAYFDLIGLPPTWQEVEDFARDDSVHAFSQRIDRLLASPQYGERWGRHWLDLARYCDETAPFLHPVGDAWRYRDWVVHAFNSDLPYDRFVQLQLAADHIPDSVISDLAALGFLGLSPVYFKEFKLNADVIRNIVADEWEERIDAIGRTFLGLTLACARCHDHKFDPIRVEDYYALAGVIAGTRLTDRPLLPPRAAAVVMESRNRIALLQQKIDKAEQSFPRDPDWERQIQALQVEIDVIKMSTAHMDAPVVHAVDDAALVVVEERVDWTRLDYRIGQAIDVPIHIRGNPSREGQIVPRRFIEVLDRSDPHAPWDNRGRLHLAEAIVRDGAPLTARVIVNRVWQHHFGVGLVDTPSDFGAQGSRPSHPELLDDLTARFIASGWSIKWLHREILLSATWQQASRGGTRSTQIDPDNRLVGRMTRRRLEFEAWRDAMLAVSGALDARLGGSAIDLQDDHNVRRTLYGRINRYDLHRAFRLFDFPEPSAHSPARFPTTTPLQQLFVLNGDLLLAQARNIIERLDHTPSTTMEQRLVQLYRRIFQRDPTSSEIELGRSFLFDAATDVDPRRGESAIETASTAQDRWEQFAQVLLASNEFLFIE